MPRFSKKGLSPHRKQRTTPTLPPNPRPTRKQKVDTTGRAEDPCDRTLAIDAEENSAVDASDFHDVVSDEMRRSSIAFAFIEFFDPPPECEWSGIDGTISNIVENLNLNPNSRKTVRRVLVDVVKCHKAGVHYDPSRKAGSGGHNKIVALGSEEEQMVADHIEGGLSLTQTTYLINLHREARGLQVLGRSAVYSAHLRLNPVVTPILDAKQGSFDEDSPWAKARLMWVLQLLIRFGIMTGIAAWTFYSPDVY